MTNILLWIALSAHVFFLFRVRNSPAQSKKKKRIPKQYIETKKYIKSLEKQVVDLGLLQTKP